MSDKTHKFFSSSSPSFSVEIVITRLAYKFRNIFDIEMGERVTILEIGHGLCPWYCRYEYKITGSAIILI